MLFKEIGFSVKFLLEDVKLYYIVYLLQLEDINSGEIRIIFYFYYIIWLDFGVFELLVLFFNFLFKVREFGFLNFDYGFVVIYCSVGIGCFGIFFLVDICFVLMEKGDDINIK